MKKVANSGWYQYFGSDDDTRASSDTACERFYQHRAFLIKSMLEGQEGLDWEVSPIFRHFERKFTVWYLMAFLDDRSHKPSRTIS